MRIWIALTICVDISRSHRIFTESFDDFASRYPPMDTVRRSVYREKARDMFVFGYDNYMKYAFPMDELDPIHCVGRGHDYYDLSNININDVLGDYSLTLVDALDTLAVLGNVTEFHRAIRLVIDTVSFNRDTTVQVFEASIRILGSLLSTHIMLTDPEARIGGVDVRMREYNDELLEMAHDLAARLLPAFEDTPTGIPYPRVNLGGYEVRNQNNVTCTAGAGSLLLEFGVLSRLLDDPTYEMLARRTNRAIYNARDNATGLLGNLINVQTGQWAGFMSGLGAGIDSFYEYLLKAYILFGHVDDYQMFNNSYSTIRDHMRVGRPQCNDGAGDPPLYINVHTKDGTVVNTWIDSLQASFAGVQILSGDLDEAICQHALYYSIWRKYGVLPERFNWKLKAPDVSFYPLRPEFAESTYLLYMATKNSYYLHVGAQIIDSLNAQTRTQCGYATIHDVATGELEDRMESFFLSETCKYLYLLFDESNAFNVNYQKWIFTTEGHPLPISATMRRQPAFFDQNDVNDMNNRLPVRPRQEKIVIDNRPINMSRLTADEGQCDVYHRDDRYVLPLQSKYMIQLFDLVGFDWRATTD